MNLNERKTIERIKRVATYAEWNEYKEFVKFVFNQQIDLDKLETEADLIAAKKIKKIMRDILFENLD